MTRFQIFNDEQQGDPEKIVHLRLVQLGEGILVREVDERGNVTGCGNLIKFYLDGTYEVQCAAELNEQPLRQRT